MKSFITLYCKKFFFEKINKIFGYFGFKLLIDIALAKLTSQRICKIKKHWRQSYLHKLDCSASVSVRESSISVS